MEINDCFDMCVAAIQASGVGIEKLDFQLNPKLKTAVDKAKARVEKSCNSLSACAVQYDGYGSNLIKNCGLKADSLMQLAFQVSAVLYTCFY